MEEFYFLGAPITNYIYVLIMILVSSVLPRLSRLFGGNKTEHQKLMVEKMFRYFFYLITFFISLKLYNINLKVILGAAGIFSVAVGFASQTSASNLISGLFLLMERPFKTGDTIVVGDIKGIVLAMDLLSTRLRTFDNMLVRIPNESLMKSNLVNMTHFPIRRIDIKIPLDFKVDLELVERVLNDITVEIAECLDEPKPIFVVEGIIEHSLIVQFSFWARLENLSSVKKKVYSRMLARLANLNVRISVPQNLIFAQEN